VNIGPRFSYPHSKDSLDKWSDCIVSLASTTALCPIGCRTQQSGPACHREARIPDPDACSVVVDADNGTLVDQCPSGGCQGGYRRSTTQCTSSAKPSGLSGSITRRGQGESGMRRRGRSVASTGAESVVASDADRGDPPAVQACNRNGSRSIMLTAWLRTERSRVCAVDSNWHVVDQRAHDEMICRPNGGKGRLGR